MRSLFFAFAIVLAYSTSASAQHWLTDFKKAKYEASKENRKIILVFQGSDWCAPCIKLDKAVWSTDEFNVYARENFVMLQADFPRKKINKLPEDLEKHNGRLAERYNQNGHFPLVVILDMDGNVLGKTGYKNVSVEEYIKHLESFNL